ncbi:MAG: hypothetical protein V4713_12465 [Pseudomonadota bacterium]
MNDANTTKITETQTLAARPQPVVTRTKTAWLLGESIQVVAPPSPVLTRKITYNPQAKVSLTDVAASITQKTGLSIDTSEVWSFIASNNASGQTSAMAPAMPQPVVPSLSGQGMPNNQAQTNSSLFNIEYDGPVAGLLDLAANKAGVWWKYLEGRVTFFRTETKTFYIPALPNASSGRTTIASGIGGSSSSTSGGSSGGATTTTSGGTNSDSTYSVDIWKDLEKTAQTVGGTARVVANSSVGSVTVTGTPTQIRNVEEWVKSLADGLSQQVQISITVYKVDQTAEDNYSWNPSVIFNSVSGQYGFNLTAPQAPSVVSGTTPMNYTATVLSSATGSAAQFSGTQLAFKALSSLGKTTVVYNQSLVSLNRRAAQMQNADVEGYLAARTPSAPVAVGATPLPPTLTPGSITTGFTATFIPVVVNGKVLLSMNMTISANKGFGTGGTGDSTIMLANAGLNTFEQSTSLTPGDAIMLTGVSQQSGKSNRTGVGSPDFYLLGGGVDHTVGKQMLAIVVEAKVL